MCLPISLYAVCSVRPCKDKFKKELHLNETFNYHYVDGREPGGKTPPDVAAKL